MVVVHLVLGSAVVLLSLAAALLGGWCWWRHTPHRVFWPLLRASQGALILQVALGALLLVFGHRPANSLHFIYGLLPIPVVFAAEQLRVASAEVVLESRGLHSAQEVGTLPEQDQRQIVLQIVLREIVVMALASLVVFALAARAAMTSGAF